MKEQFKWIKGYEGIYKVSNLGKVKSIKRKGRKRSFIMKTYSNSNGYYFKRLTKDRKLFNYTVHSLVANAFIPNPDNLKVVGHIDGDKKNNRVDNIEWRSYKSNTKKYLERRNVDITNFIKSGTGGRKAVKCTKTGQEFVSIASAARHIGRHPQYLRDCLAGREKNCTTMVLI